MATFSSNGGYVTTDIGSFGSVALDIVLQSDGKILAVGGVLKQSLASVPGWELGDAFPGTDYADFALVRYNADGSLDTSFGGDGIVTTAVGTSHDQAMAVALQSNGGIVVVGSIDTGADSTELTKTGIVRYTSTGDLDSSFGQGGIVTLDIGSGYELPRDVVIQPDGKIVLCGLTSASKKSDGVFDFSVVRLNTDGSLDTSFSSDGIYTLDSGTFDMFTSLTLQSDGKIVAAGTVDIKFAVLRLNSDGTADTGIIDPNAAGSATDVAIQSDGKIVVTGHAEGAASGGGDSFGLTRYNTDLTVDSSFDKDGYVTTSFGDADAEGLGLALQSDGKIVVTGWSGTDGADTFALARYNTDGSLDKTFSGDGKQTTKLGNHANAFAVTIASDGSIIVAGERKSSSAANVDGADFVIAQYDASGNLGGNASGGSGSSGTPGETITGGSTDDTLPGGDGGDTISGGEGNDYISGGDGNDSVIGGDGNDTVDGGTGIDYIEGGAGNDSIDGGTGNDKIYGGSGDDVLDGGEGADYMEGGEGADTYYVNSTKDKVVEVPNTTPAAKSDPTLPVDIGSNIDTVISIVKQTLTNYVENLVLTGTGNLAGTGNTENNTLTGNAGNNKLSGKVGNDSLAGGEGNDSLAGDAGDDTLVGGAGTDKLKGGADTDVFVLSYLNTVSTDADSISDFTEADVLKFDTTVFTALVGATSDNLFIIDKSTTTSPDANDFLVYDSTKGFLYYDADGSGSASTAVKIVALKGADAKTTFAFDDLAFF